VIEAKKVPAMIRMKLINETEVHANKPRSTTPETLRNTPSRVLPVVIFVAYCLLALQLSIARRHDDGAPSKGVISNVPVTEVDDPKVPRIAYR
jgi:hypothetical protein